MSDTLGFRITADGCSWICADCGKEFPASGSLHLCEAKLPEEYRQLREQIATLTRQRDEARAALEEAQETIDTIRLNPDDAEDYAEQYINGEQHPSTSVVLAARDERMKRQGAVEALRVAIGEVVIDGNPQILVDKLERRIAELEAKG